MQKVNNSIATKLRVKLINNCTTFLKKIVHDTIQWLNCVMHILNMKINWKCLRTVMHSFEVHSNERSCRKKVRLGPKQVVCRSPRNPPEATTRSKSCQTWTTSTSPWNNIISRGVRSTGPVFRCLPGTVLPPGRNIGHCEISIFSTWFGLRKFGRLGARV